MYEPGKVTPMAQRFRGFLPVVVDVETGGFNPRTDALLEIAAVTLRMTESGELEPDETVSTHVQPFAGANLEPKSLEVTGIDPWHPLRAARNEHDALSYVFQPVRRAVKDNGCTRAILVGHNASFDLGFVNAAVERSGIRRNPFHPFSYLDTVTLGALAYGQTVLARASRAAGLEWEQSEAHSAVYDTRMTARLFCEVVNRWEALHAETGEPTRTEEEQ
ncbi:MAG: ribonuclease T [Halofilum sp. (in: g-proteobacteria)]